jgi:hypothetical protein
MANWSNPLLTSTYTNFVTEVKDRDTDLALQFDGTTTTNIPTNTIRWNSSINRWQKWNGSSWAELTSTYALTGLSTTGNATIGGTLGSGAITSTGSVSGTALIPTANTAPTNGVYLPNANTVGIATSGAGRVFVGAAGRFGVGTSTPGTAIDVTLSAGSATTGNIRISPSTAGQARFHLFNGGAIAEWIFGQKTSTDHDFKLSKLVAGSEADYLTVNTSGSVGIGTTSPGSLLDVNGAITARGDGSQVALYMPGNTAIRSTGAGSITYLDLATGSASHGDFILRSSNTYAERLRVNSAGNVGIGTSSPGSLLDVRFPTSPTTDNGIGSNTLRVWTSSALAADTGGAISLGGISTTGGSASSYGQIAGRKVNATSANYAGYLQFSVNNAVGTMFEAMRIDSTGRLLVGTSTARSLYGQTGVLQTEGTGYASSGVNIILNNASTAGPLLMLGKSRGSANGSSTIVQNGDALGEIYFCGADGTDLDTPGAGIRAVVDGAPGSNDMPGRLEFSTTADGASNPTERLRIDSSGRVGIGTISPLGPLHVASTPTGTSNIYVAPTTAGLAAIEVYNGGPTCGWRTGQRSSSDHDWSLDQMVAGVAYNKLQVTATGVLKFDSGYGASANAYGCRAWVNFNGTGTVAIRASANVSSITDNGIGDYTVNFTTAMPDANYAAVTNAVDRTASRVTAYAAGSARVLTYDTGLLDSTAVSVAVFR